jgi:probable rRNA maturation factor
LPVRLGVEGARALAPRGLRVRLERRALAMLALLQLEKAELSLVLSGDAEIRELNKVYRGKDKATDVLAFSMREGDFGRLHAALPSRLLGDVIVSVPTAERQASAAKRDPLAEMTMLVAHGLLHLLGWDHETPAKDRKMRRETERLVLVAETADPDPARVATRPARKASKRATLPAKKRALVAPKRSRKASESTKQKRDKRAT